MEYIAEDPMFLRGNVYEIESAGGKFIKTEDDRIVEYAVRGSTSKDARVIVSAYVAENLVSALPPSFEEAFEKLNVRSITISLPGFGHSSFCTGLSIADWPRSDLLPILRKEGVSEFFVWGVSLGTLYAMATAQYFASKEYRGSIQVKGLGLRVPFMPKSLSKELGLPDGQPTFPTSEEVRRNTFKVQLMRFFLSKVYGLMLNPGQGCFMKLLKGGWFGANAQCMVTYGNIRPHEMKYVLEGVRYQSSEALMYLIAQDVILECPGFDFRKIKLKGSEVVVWYASDDGDCPPSHGQYLAKHFDAQTRVFNGYGHLGGGFEDMGEFFACLVDGSKKL